MPAFQYVQTNTDPSVPEALQGVAQVIDNGHQIAMRNQLFQLQLEAAASKAKTDQLNQQLLSQALSQGDKLFASKLKGAEAQASQAQTQAQWAPSQMEQQSVQGEQGIYRNDLLNQQLPVQQQQQQQAGQQGLDMGAVELALKKNVKSASDDALQAQTEEHLARWQTREGKQKLGSAIGDELAKMTGNTKFANFSSPFMADQTIQQATVFGIHAAQMKQQNDQLKAQIDYHQQLSDRAQTKMEEEAKYHAMAMLLKDPRAREAVLAANPNNAELKAAIDALPQGPEDVLLDPNADHAAKMGAGIILHQQLHGGQLPTITKPDPNNMWGEGIKETDYGLIEKELPYFEQLIKNKRTKGQGTTPTTQTAEKPKGAEGSSEDSPKPLKSGDNWRALPAGTWVTLPGKPKAFQITTAMKQ